MKSEMLEKLDGYEDIIRQISKSREAGTDFQEQKGEVGLFINSLHPKQVELEVIDIIRETKSTQTIRFAPKRGKLPPFLAGQYISLFLEIDNIRTSRPYSISSSPTERGYWDLTVRLVENGLVSHYLQDEIKIGDSFASSGPQGNFYFNPLIHSKDMICLAGGSGITPFMSMIREIVSKQLDRKIHLIYGVNTQEEAIFHDLLKELAASNESINYVPVIENPPNGYQGHRGFICSDVISETAGNLSDKSVFICGPQGMYDFCEEQLDALHYPKYKIRKEMYGVPVNAWLTPGWPQDVHKDKEITVYCEGEKIACCTASDSLLTVLEQNHKAIPGICRSGECSMCRVKLVKGEVFQPHGTLLRKSDRQFGYIHACASYPLTDIEIRF